MIPFAGDQVIQYNGKKITKIQKTVTNRITITFGIADYGEKKDAKELIWLADARLYSGKNSGRIRIIVCCGGQDGE